MKAKGNLLVNLLHTATLCTLALGQPLFDLLSRNAEFFVVRRSQPIDLILLALALGLAPALGLTLVQAVLVGRRVRRFSHTIITAVLLSALALLALKHAGWQTGVLLIPAAGLLGAAAAAAYVRLAAVRLFLTVLSPAVLLCPLLFLCDSQVMKVLRPASSSEAAAAPVATRTPIVMIVFDEFPLISLLDKDLRVDESRYPHFAALARESHWFRDATTVHQMTTHAVPALLTGRYADWSQLPIQADYPQNLFTWLEGTHRLKVFEPVTRLCPNSVGENGEASKPIGQRLRSLAADLSVVYLHLVAPNEWSARLPAVTHGWKDFRTGACCGSLVVSEDRPRQFARFLDSLDNGPQPAVYFVHLVLPHWPFNFLPSGKHYGINAELDGVVPPGHQWGSCEERVNRTYQRHLLQIGYADALLGRAVERLKQMGLYERCLLVVAADHGICFQPGDSYRHLSATNYPDILRVPLFIKKPQQKNGVVSDRKVQLIDVLPTIAEMLGEKLPWPVDGRSALDESQPEWSERVCFNRETKWTFGRELDGNFGGLARKLALFGAGSPDGLYRAGPHPELVGRPVAEIGVAGDSGVTIETDKARFLTSVDPHGAFLPAHLKGVAYTAGASDGLLDLAVALNGTICTVTRSHDHSGGAGQWAAMLPEDAFQKGRNRVDVFVVRTAEGKPALYRTFSSSSDDYAWDQEGSRLTANGQAVPIRARAFQGHLDYVHVQGDCLEFGGWSAEVQRGRLPKVVAIFAGDRLIQAVRPNSERPDLVQAYGHETLRWAGFRVSVPAILLREMGDPEVRLFAVGEEAATELRYPAAYKKRGYRPVR